MRCSNSPYLCRISCVINPFIYVSPLAFRFPMNYLGDDPPKSGPLTVSHLARNHHARASKQSLEAKPVNRMIIPGSVPHPSPVLPRPNAHLPVTHAPPVSPIKPWHGPASRSPFSPSLTSVCLVGGSRTGGFAHVPHLRRYPISEAGLLPTIPGPIRGWPRYGTTPTCSHAIDG